MTKSSAEASQCEARPWKETQENFSPAQPSEWSNISRQCLDVSSNWHAARDSRAGIDPTLDKAALNSGVLQFGSIDELTGNKSKAGDSRLSAPVNDKSAAAPSADKTPEAKAAMLFSNDATPEQKLATVRDLANTGITSMSYRDSSGSERKLRFEVEGAGNRQMVHLFDSGADCREKTALRGISSADGTFEKQRDQQGNSVDYQGKGYSNLAQAQADTLKVDAADTSKPAQRSLPGSERRTVPETPRDSRADRSTDGRDNVAPNLIPGAVDRSQFDSQLKDPRVMAAFAGRMHSEVGSQGPAAQLAFAEEVMNRAASRNQTIMQALTGKYYPTHNPGWSNNPRYMEEGTDTIFGATGNASGKVGFGVRGGHYDANRQWVSPNQTVRINGERFGYEQVDLNRGWMKKYQQLKSGSRV
jgi:hypothetical protein